MSEAPLIASAPDLALYALDGGRFGLLQLGSDFRPGRHAVDWTADLAHLLRTVLVQHRSLYAAGNRPVFLVPGRKPLVALGPEQSWEFLHRLVFFALAEPTEAPPTLTVPSAALEGTPAEQWAAICRSNELRRTELTRAGPRFVQSLAGHEDVPPWGGILRHPLVGDLPRGWFGVPEPPEPDNYDLLRSLFEPLPLDEASHARLYSFLLGCFHADSLTCPVPLLVVDSWTQAIGKTEACGALSELINAGRSNLSPPSGGNTDEIVAYYNSGARLACLDNLVSDRAWNNSWLCTILTDRAATARAKFDAKTSTFAGRLATLTFVFGDAVLHPDLLSRTWRVQLWGHEPKALAHRPNKLAQDHRAELQAQVYWTMKLAAPLPAGVRLTTTRCTELEALGGAGYCHLFGLSPTELEARLARSAKDVQGLSAAFSKFLSSNQIDFGSVPKTPAARLRPHEKNLIASARAFGYTPVEGKPEPLPKETARYAN